MDKFVVGPFNLFGGSDVYVSGLYIKTQYNTIAGV